MARPRQKKRRSSLSKVRQSNTSKAARVNPLSNPTIAKSWRKSDTLTQNYRRLGLVSRLKAPTGGVEHRAKDRVDGTKTGQKPESTAAATGKGRSSEPLYIDRALEHHIVKEVVVERDPATGHIKRVVRPAAAAGGVPLPPSRRASCPNPLNDPLAPFDSTDDESNDGGQNGDGGDSSSWHGFDDSVTDNPSTPKLADTELLRELERQAAELAALPKVPRWQSAREKEWIQALVDKYGDDTAAMVWDKKLNPMQQTEADIKRRIRKWRESQKSG